MSSRSITHRYSDPADHIWIETARRIGLKVVRDSGAYASTDGARTLAIAGARDLDADDCLAQMIFHELCHSLVEGPEAFDRADWGLDNTSDRDVPNEHACLRTQAMLAGRFGLRRVLAPSTDFREFYDRLGPDPLADRRDESTAMAILAVRRAETPPWAPHLRDALAATAAIARAASPFARDSDLWSTLDAPLPSHPTGRPQHAAGVTCGDCAWRDDGGQCRQSDSVVDSSWPGCERFERKLDCQTCGACCRAAYHSVTVEDDDAVIAAHPELIVRRDSYIELRRNSDRCAALLGSVASGFTCSIYSERPRPCREFELGGEHCLVARRRVGLTL